MKQAITVPPNKTNSIKASTEVSPKSKPTSLQSKDDGPGKTTFITEANLVADAVIIRDSAESKDIRASINKHGRAHDS